MVPIRRLRQLIEVLRQLLDLLLDLLAHLLRGCGTRERTAVRSDGRLERARRDREDGDAPFELSTAEHGGSRRVRGRDAGKDAHLQLLRGELSELNRLVFRIRHGTPCGIYRRCAPKICPQKGTAVREKMSTEVMI